MTMKLTLHHRKKFDTIISTYAPTITNTDETKDKFYEDFEFVIFAVPTVDKSIILGDLNPRVVPLEKEYWINTGLKNATAMTYSFFIPVPSIIF